MEILSSLAAHIFLPSLDFSDKSPPLHNARHEGTRNVSYRSSSLCRRTACSWRVKGKPWRLVCLYLYGSNSGLMMRFGKVSLTKLMVTILGQRTFAPSWEQNSTWADARIPSVSPLAFAPRSRSKSLQFHLLNLSRATSETVLHYTIVFEKKIHEIFVNQDEQRVLPIIVWTSIAVCLVKHDPWSSPASDVTEHDVILHSSHWLTREAGTALRTGGVNASMSLTAKQVWRRKEKNAWLCLQVTIIVMLLMRRELSNF